MAWTRMRGFFGDPCDESEDFCAGRRGPDPSALRSARKSAAEWNNEILAGAILESRVQSVSDAVFVCRWQAKNILE